LAATTTGTKVDAAVAVATEDEVADYETDEEAEAEPDVEPGGIEFGTRPCRHLTPL